MMLLWIAAQVAGAVPPAAVPDTLALSPAEREAALVEGEARASRGEAPINGAPLAIHGEVGVAVGSQGARAAWGTAAVPLGQTGQATFSVAQERYGGRPRP